MAVGCPPASSWQGHSSSGPRNRREPKVGPDRSAGTKEDHGTERDSRTPRVRPTFARMLKTQVRSDDRPSNRPSPRTTASHVSWTTSWAEASVDTYVRATRSSLGDHASTTAANAVSSPLRRRTRSGVDLRGGHAGLDAHRLPRGRNGRRDLGQDGAPSTPRRTAL